jgi:hypothetical protein
VSARIGAAAGLFRLRRAGHGDRVAIVLGVVACHRVHDGLFAEFVAVHQCREVSEEQLPVGTGSRLHADA